MPWCRVAFPFWPMFTRQTRYENSLPFLKSYSKSCLLVDVNGHPIVARPNPAIPRSVIFQMSDLRNNQMMSLEDAVTFIRGKLVPDGYTPFPFRRDTPESFLDKLRSVVATNQFRHEVQYWRGNDADFSLYSIVQK